jgi:hypothetical protein
MPSLTDAPTAQGLSEDQVRFFKAFGYIVLKRFFSPSEVDTINREFDHAMAEQYPHKPFDGTARHWSMMLDEETPLFAGMMEDPRFLVSTKQLYGDGVLGVATDANRYVGDTGWHRDTATIHQYGIKWAFYLQPVGADTGALRVIPSSYRYPDDPEYTRLVSTFKIGEVPCQALVSEPGDVVGFDVRTYHASLGGRADRRMCTVVYYSEPKTDAEKQALLVQAKNNSKISYQQFGCKRQYLYSARWMANPGRNPDRQLWIDRLTEIGYFDAPGLVEK